MEDQVTQHRTVLELVCTRAVLVYHLPCTAFSSYQQLVRCLEETDFLRYQVCSPDCRMANASPERQSPN